MGLGSNQTDTPLLHNLQITRSVYGIAIPIGAGTFRVQGNLLWWGDFNSDGTAYNLGGKGLGKSSEYDYTASVLALLCQGPLSGIGNVWGQNGRLTLQTVSEDYTVPGGGGTYTVNNSNNYNADQGVSVATPYSVTANDYGSPGPVTLTGTTQTVVPLGAGGYTMPTPGQYAIVAAYAGQTVTISYSFSLYTVEASEDYNIPNTSPWEITVTNQPDFYADAGVVFVDTGLSLTAVGGTPTLTGTYNPNGGNYLFASVDGLRPVVINYEWQQSQSSINPGATLSFDLLEGGQDQSPWSYLVSKHLSQAVGYTTLAMIGAANMDLGPSGQMEDYNYECYGPFQFGAGILDADMSQFIVAFLQDLLWGAQFPGAIDGSLSGITRDYWASNSFFCSPLLDSARPASDYVNEWCEAGNVGCFWSENSLKFIPYGDTTQVGNGYTFSPLTSPVVDLDDTDFLTEGPEDPIEQSRTAFQDAFNEVHVQFSNRLNNYDDDSVILQDDNAVSLYGLHPEGQKSYGFIRTIPAANFTASVRLKRLVNIRQSYTFKISGIRYCFLEPMDLVTITDPILGLIETPCRILEISEDEKRVYTIKAEEFPWGTATATLYPKQPVQPPPQLPMLNDPGNTIIVELFEPPAAVAATVANNLYQIWMALTGGPNWGGCYVMFSLDGNSYEQLTPTQVGTSRGGSLTASLPYSADPDSTDTLSVQTSGQLFNVSLAQCNAFATLSKIGGEYIAYENVALTGSSQLTNDYNLTYLRRGCFSTPILSHIAGEPFVRIDSQIFQYSYNPNLIGKAVYFKFLSFNLVGQMVQTLADVPAIPFLVGGQNVSQNMVLLALNSGGWEIEVYRAGQPVGTAGAATLANGAMIPLPADTITGLSASTLYYVNYNFGTSAYVTYTSQSAQLADQAAGDCIGIGQVSTTGGGGGAYMPMSSAGPGAYGDFIYQPSVMRSVFTPNQITYYNFPNATPAGVTLYVTASCNMAPPAGVSETALITVSWDGGATWNYLQSFSATTPSATYSISVPGGTNLNQVQVLGAVNASPTTVAGAVGGNVSIGFGTIEIY